MDQNRNDNDLFNFDNPPPQPPSGGPVPSSTPPSGGARVYDTPESDRVETPPYTPPPPYTAPPPTGQPPAGQPPKRNNTIWIVAIVVVLLLCCCCLALAGIWLWNNGDALMQDMEFNLLPLVEMI